jgi:hypothetical protein
LDRDNITVATFRVVSQYSDRSGFVVAYQDTNDLREALIARDAAARAGGNRTFIIVASPDDDADYSETLSDLGMASI